MTFFTRGRSGEPGPAVPLARSPVVAGPVVAKWQMRNAEHWKSGHLSGDYNGIHLWDWYARRLGFRRALCALPPAPRAGGMSCAAAAAAGFECTRWPDATRCVAQGARASRRERSLARRDEYDGVRLYTDDARYHDPNTRGEVTGRDALRRYLARLFGAWTMTWSAREVFDLADEEGVAFRWRATFRRAGEDAVIEIDGMDLAVLRGNRVARNEVYFDRTALAAGLGST